MRRVALAVAGLWLMLPVVPASACSCAINPLPAQVSAADVVFRGEAVTVTPREDQLRVTFRVLRAYKGEPGAFVEVSTGASSSACGVGFATGTEYLVFASRAGDAYVTSICAGTTEDVGALDRSGIAAREAVDARAPVAALPSPPQRGRGAVIAIAAIACAIVMAAQAGRYLRTR